MHARVLQPKCIEQLLKKHILLSYNKCFLSYYQIDGLQEWMCRIEKEGISIYLSHPYYSSKFISATSSFIAWHRQLYLSGLSNYYAKEEKGFSLKQYKKKEICLFMGQLSVICYSSDRTCHSTLHVLNRRKFGFFYIEKNARETQKKKRWSLT